MNDRERAAGQDLSHEPAAARSRFAERMPASRRDHEGRKREPDDPRDGLPSERETEWQVRKLTHPELDREQHVENRRAERGKSPVYPWGVGHGIEWRRAADRRQPNADERQQTHGEPDAREVESPLLIASR